MRTSHGGFGGVLQRMNAQPPSLMMHTHHLQSQEKVYPNRHAFSARNRTSHRPPWTTMVVPLLKSPISVVDDIKFETVAILNSKVKSYALEKFI